MGIISLVLTVIMAIWVFYGVFEKQQKEDIQLHCRLLKKICQEIDSYDELDRYVEDEMRVTIISSDGNVLYDSGADEGQMENHGDRTEVEEAFEHGVGETLRHSDTLGYDTYYYALLLDTGDVLRLSMDVDTMYQSYNNALPGIIVVAALVMIISILFSVLLTKSLVKPIEKMAENIEDIDKDVPYKELKPFALAVKDYQTKKEQHANIRHEFTANVSHELKTPLTSISGYAEMIETGIAKESDIKVFAGKIRLEAGRLLNLIGDILRLSELDETTSELVIQKENVDLMEVIKNTINLLSFKAEEAGINLYMTGEPTFVYGNARMLEELVYNLCDNAIKYNKKGGYVRCHVGRNDGKPELIIQDNGIGISTEHQDRVFERFYRVDKSRSKATGGTGLGLAIVKHIAINHNAKIRMKSALGKGTEIRVIFG